MQTVGIIGLVTCAAVAYGILHDQVTARLSVEYFTIGHPPFFMTDSPALLALGWGVLATWWLGVPLGIVLAAAARAGRRPKRAARTLVRPLGALMLFMAFCALLAGLLGAALALHGTVTLTQPLATLVPTDRHIAFLAALWAHSASYGAGVVGAILLSVHVWRDRSRAAMHRGQPHGM
ncbi:MAG TPA: hypothetical protein VJ650_12285 [Gemmatimonadaceae bacterium]|nr:hypothetical protein [Gemmatimonadaceae bacterium]